MQLQFNGEPGPAAPLMERVFAVRSDDPMMMARISQMHATHSLFEGDPSENLTSVAASADFFTQAGSLRDACFQTINAGFSAACMGLYDEAEPRLRDATAAADRLGVSGASGLARQNLAFALLGRGAFAEARRVLEELFERDYGQSDRRLAGYNRIYYAEVLRGLGDLGGAEREIRTALELLVATAPARAYARAVLARVLLAKGRVGEALVEAREAEDQLEALGGIDEGEATVRLVFAEAVDASGDRSTAIIAIRAARDRLLARAAHIRKELWRASFLERVPDNARTVALAVAWGVR